MSKYLINSHGWLLDSSTPRVMAIINVTPDSFYAASRANEESSILQHAEQALTEGADWLDIGACSTRPGSEQPSQQEEWQRLESALRPLRAHFPEARLSVDTYRADIARRAVWEYGVNLINDISGGEMDAAMFGCVAALRVPYILSHMRGTPRTMQQMTDYENLMQEIIHFFQLRLDQLHRLGVTDVILDPGFGFAKTKQQCFHLLSHLSDLQVLECPVMAGLSRKSMLSADAQQALPATIAANMAALMGGAGQYGAGGDPTEAVPADQRAVLEHTEPARRMDHQ